MKEVVYSLVAISVLKACLAGIEGAGIDNGSLVVVASSAFLTLEGLGLSVLGSLMLIYILKGCNLLFCYPLY